MVACTGIFDLLQKTNEGNVRGQSGVVGPQASAIEVVCRHEQLESHLRLDVEVGDALRRMRVADLVVQVLDDLCVWSWWGMMSGTVKIEISKGCAPSLI